MSYVFITIGIVIRVIAMLQLKRNFSLELTFPKELVISGVYKYIRHPCYVGSFFIIVGIALISELAAIIVIAFAFYGARAVNEEQILKQVPGYIEYIGRTGMFTPRFRRHKNARSTTDI